MADPGVGRRTVSPDSGPHPEMTIDEAAGYLRMPRSSLLALARAGELPAERVDNAWRFRRTEVERWRSLVTGNLRNLGQGPESEAAAGCLESRDIEEYEGLMTPWDLRLDQLSNGSFHTKVQYTKLPGILVYEANWERAAHTCGQSPEGLVMIGTNLAWRRASNYWCSQAVDHRRFACTGPNSEFSHTSPDRSHHTVMLIDRTLLAAAIGEAAVERICRRQHLALSATDGERLMAAMTGVVRTAKDFPALLNDTHEVAQAKSWLLDSLGRGLESEEADGTSGLRREAAVHQAIDLVDRAQGPVTALQLAIAVSVTQRTLERGFRELLGMTPAAYLRRYRMNRAQHELAHADPGSTTVTDIALGWGFSHAGRFSADYRRLFAEAPSETLKQSPKRAARRLRSRIVAPIQ